MIKLPAWAQRNNEGPPDLDEVLRDLSQKINNLFGRKGGGNSGNTTPSESGKGFDVPILPILALIVAIWMATGFYIVKEGSVGVEQRFGKFTSVTKSGANWHLPYPVEEVEIVNMELVRKLEVGYQSGDDGLGGKIKVPKEALMLTEDENIIDMQVAVQYKLKNAVDFLYNNRDAEKAVKAAAESAIREVVGKSKLDDLILTGLPPTAERMQAILDNYKTGIQITSVSRQKGAAPEQVKEAFDDVNRAQQDYQRLINEGQSYANEVIPKARGAASRLAAEAAGYKLKVENESKGNASRFEQILAQYNKAPEVTRERIYLDAQEQILSNTSKVIVDQKGGSLLYLPLDKLMATANAAPTSAGAAASVSSNKAEIATDQQRELLRDRN
jgi:modulator of FtsH protease HflK